MFDDVWNPDPWLALGRQIAIRGSRHYSGKKQKNISKDLCYPGVEIEISCDTYQP